MNGLFPQYTSTPSTNIVVWLGASGTRYEFQVNAIGSVYRMRAGVYIFCKPIGSDSWDAVYVGQTDNFARRLSHELTSHHRWQCVLTAGASHICTLHIPSAVERVDVETDLRNHLNPHCNRQ